MVSCLLYAGSQYLYLDIWEVGNIILLVYFSYFHYKEVVLDETCHPPAGGQRVTLHSGLLQPGSGRETPHPIPEHILG